MKRFFLYGIFIAFATPLYSSSVASDGDAASSTESSPSDNTETASSTTDSYADNKRPCMGRLWSTGNSTPSSSEPEVDKSNASISFDDIAHLGDFDDYFAGESPTGSVASPEVALVAPLMGIVEELREQNPYFGAEGSTKLLVGALNKVYRHIFQGDENGGLHILPAKPITVIASDKTGVSGGEVIPAGGLKKFSTFFSKEAAEEPGFAKRLLGIAINPQAHDCRIIVRGEGRSLVFHPSLSWMECYYGDLGVPNSVFPVFSVTMHPIKTKDGYYWRLVEGKQLFFDPAQGDEPLELRQCIVSFSDDSMRAYVAEAVKNDVMSMKPRDKWAGLRYHDAAEKTFFVDIAGAGVAAKEFSMQGAEEIKQGVFVVFPEEVFAEMNCTFGSRSKSLLEIVEPFFKDKE